MTVIVVEKAIDALSGYLSRWLIEVKPGVFVGNLSRRVEGYLWEYIEDNYATIDVLLIRSAPETESGYEIKSIGVPKRKIKDFEGLSLILMST